MSSTKELQDKSVRLFTYLRELTQLKTKVTLDLKDYEQVLWFSDIPNEKECSCIAWGATEDESSESWIEVKKPKRKDPPPPPDELKEWVTLKELKDSTKAPKILDFITRVEKIVGTEEEKTIVVHFNEVPALSEAWEIYLKKSWQPWSLEDQRVLRVETIYKDLFSIHQKQQKLGEAYEVVLGLGLLTCNGSVSKTVRRHILTARAVVGFDSHKGIITVGPPDEGTKLVFEQEMLDPQKRPDATTSSALELQALEIGEELWDRVSVEAVLKSWTNALSSDSRFENSLSPQGKTSETPVVHFAPAVILRKQTERNLIRVYQDIIDQLNSGVTVPLGVSRLVDIVDDTSETNQSENPNFTEANPVPHKEVLFPLPSNREQKEIAEKIASRQGVLVQGPPGTGKSHTIANLVCHLLADGQRVLVTSHTPRALKVLQDKFPKEISALCVSLLGDDMNGMKALEDSVQGITDKYNHWNPNKNNEDIKSYESALRSVRAEMSNTLRLLRELREAETYKHPSKFGIYEGTLSSIAAKVKDDEHLYHWFSDRPKKLGPPPISNSEIVELYELTKLLSEDIETQLAQELPAKDKLLTTKEFESLVEMESVAKTVAEGRSQYKQYHLFSKLQALDSQTRDQLSETVKNVKNLILASRKHGFSWIVKAHTNIFSERDRLWRELLDQTQSTTVKLRKTLKVLEETTITGLDGQDLQSVRSQAADLYNHFMSGGGLGFGPFKSKVVRNASYIISNVKVNGRECKNAEATNLLIKWIDVSEGLRKQRGLWAELGEKIVGSSSMQLGEFEDLCEPIETLLSGLELVRSVREKHYPEPNWSDLDDLTSYINSLDAIRAEENRSKTTLKLVSLGDAIKPANRQKAHAVYSLLADSFSQRSVGKYQAAIEHIDMLAQAKGRKEKRDLLLSKMAQDLPDLYRKIERRNESEGLASKLETFENAWAWACTRVWIQEMTDSNAQHNLSLMLKSQRTREQEAIRALGAAKAWSFCFARMNEMQRQHLIAWSKAVKKIGKGTGKYANKHRRDAREHMEKCRSAIPAWIMPIHRVAESVKPGTDVFDIAIVDEASQSGPEALFLHYLAKKIVVVGDDKQISPDSWLDKENVQALREKWIKDVPFSNNIGVDDSFFDLASIRFKGRIRLREHFRCMPEIIQFSNNLCYQSEPLIPLKQIGGDRIEPVVAAVHVQNGYQQGSTGKIWNPPEAEAVVSKIQELINNPRYKGKTIGVVSLLGELHARQIEKQLLETIGPEEIERRELVCGDAYAFQGDERDVMILSLVSAPTEGFSIGVLSKDKDARRFNVAASRAKEQMWLFHTATINDLNPKCLRYQLLEYCQNPQIKRASIDGVSIDDIRELSRKADRSISGPPSPFDSWFEIDVFFKIHDRGFRVLPQYEVAGRRIDLVIEGMKGQLAVECDGDFWHGPDKYEEDMARQRDLERCGWKFWRIRESSFRLDPEGSLLALWEALESQKITPWVATEEVSVQESITLKVSETVFQAVNEIEATLTNVELAEPRTVGKAVLELDVDDSHRNESSFEMDETQLKLIALAKSVKEEIWFRISQNDELSPFQKRLAYTMGKVARFNGNPSVKQSFWGLDTLLFAINKGIVARDELSAVIHIEQTETIINQTRHIFKKAK